MIKLVHSPRSNAGALEQEKFKREIVMNWREYITSNPSVCHGKMCI
ncbi:hypothetical protein [Candidatus Parabeggiatoa sp. HSG14]|nr:hypothetical protein [Thiotrichales bacterium HSG14]